MKFQKSLNFSRLLTLCCICYCNLYTKKYSNVYIDTPNGKCYDIQGKKCTSADLVILIVNSLLFMRQDK